MTSLQQLAKQEAKPAAKQAAKLVAKPLAVDALPPPPQKTEPVSPDSRGSHKGKLSFAGGFSGGLAVDAQPLPPQKTELASPYLLGNQKNKPSFAGGFAGGLAMDAQPLPPQKTELASPDVPGSQKGKLSFEGGFSGGGGLAARRNVKVGPIAVEKEKSKKDQTGASRKRRRIEWCKKLDARYEVGREVMPSCHKGMQVLRGKQKASELPVVIKVRDKKQSFKSGEEREWRCSTEFMLNLPQSGNIAKLYEVLEDADNYYVIMEECKGQDLFECLHSTQGQLRPEEVREVLYQILTALAKLHGEGVIHKDLKLENVMIELTPSTTHTALCKAGKVWSDEDSDEIAETTEPTSPLVAKLVDFDTVEEYTPKTPKAAKDVLGTDQYIAQEAYAGNYSFASDIFAVGVIGFRLLVGKFPFDSRLFDDEPGENWVGSPKMKEIRQKLCKYKINWNREVFARQPEALDLLRAMLATKESERPTAKEAVDHRWFKSSRSSSHSGSDCSAGVAPVPSRTREGSR